MRSFSVNVFVNKNKPKYCVCCSKINTFQYFLDCMKNEDILVKIGRFTSTGDAPKIGRLPINL